MCAKNALSRQIGGSCLLLAMSLLSYGNAAYAAQTCAPFAPAPKVMGITSRYLDASLDKSYSILDPRKVRAQAAVRPQIDQPLVKIVSTADVYRRGGSDAKVMARCLAGYMSQTAKAHAFEGARSDADFYYADWNIAASAIAYLKAKPYLDASSDAPAIRAWFARNADRLVAFHERQRQMGKVNNHYYWGGLAVAAAGMVTGNQQQIAYGRSVLDTGLANIDQHGFLKAELARESRARHYHLFAASPLAALVMLTQADLSAVQKRRFQLLIRVIVTSLADRTGAPIAKQSGPQVPETRWSDLLLLKPFVSNDPQLTSIIDRLTHDRKPSQLQLGGDFGYLLARYRTSSST